MKPSLCLALALILGACGNEYTCPAPVGPIVRDDCDVYETRYEALAVQLGVSFAGVGVGVGVGQQAVRDPSELLQVLKLQTMALCRDYNACRVRPDEYRRRREAMDNKYTAITALNAQLATADDSATRQRIVDQLVVELRRPIEMPAPDEAPGRKVAPFRDATWMWIGSKYAAPAPTTGPAGVPPLAEWSLVLSTGLGRGELISHLRFRGAAEPDDQVYATLPDGAEVRCPVKPSAESPSDPERGAEARASCTWPDQKALPAEGELRVEYRPGLSGQRHAVAALPLSPEARLREAWLDYLPSPVRLTPVHHERPWLVVWRPEKQDQNVTLRCTHDGKPVGDVIRAISAMRAAHKLTRYHFPLPISLPYDGKVREEKDDLLPAEAAGEWRCHVSVLGQRVRSLRFKLKADGRPDQTPPPGLYSPPWWPISDVE